ncbi:MAG: flavodoxin family protein [Synergistaceae bacterium]|nr:flavodoxin family protein [Synergistaceae bacterium]
MKQVMKYTIISTVTENNKEADAVISELSALETETDIIYTDNMSICGCAGCYDCWLKTPGICSIKDDHEQIFVKLLQSDRVIFIAEVKLGFVSYKMKNLLDRMLPILTIYLKFKNGQMRHYTRYKNRTDLGLLYIGNADAEYLAGWMERVAINFDSRSLGVYEIGNRKEFYHALGDH